MSLNTAVCNRVGFWFSEKKKKKLSFEKLSISFKKYGLKAVEIDVKSSIYEQGPFVALIHNFTELIIESKSGNKSAEDFLVQLRSYIAKHPKLILANSLDKMGILLSRYETYQLVKETTICSKDKLVHVPNFAKLSSKSVDENRNQLHSAKVQYPFVCKKDFSHGFESHKMSLIFNEEVIGDIEPSSVAQTFIDHDALLYKIYVIGDKYYIVERPSLRNFAKNCYKENQTIFFHTHDISKAKSLRLQLTTLDTIKNTPKTMINDSIMQRLVSQLSDKLKMSLFGIDVVVCPSTFKHYIIDVNIFPSYDGVSNYLEKISEYISQRVHALDEGIQEISDLQKNDSKFDRLSCKEKNKYNNY